MVGNDELISQCTELISQSVEWPLTPHAPTSVPPDDCHTFREYCDRLRELAEEGRWPALCWPEFTNNGNPDPASIRNVIHMLEWAGVVVRFNEFARYREAVGVPGLGRLDADGLKSIQFTAHWLSLKVGIETVRLAVTGFAEGNKFHPVRDYLNSLQWDRKRRSYSWLTDYCGAEDTPLNRAIGRIWLVAAVRRVRQPGCKFDYLPVLIGPQGIGKSTVGRVLAGDDWFSDCLYLGQAAKATIEQSEGFWIMEIAELAGRSKREHEEIKQFVTRQVDTARGAFARDPSRRGRQFVMYGTTNDSQFLSDPSGNRRFWPIALHGQINIEALARDRDQLWAEACVLEAAGEHLFLPPMLEAEAASIQERHRRVAPQEDAILELAGTIDCGFVPTEELHKALGGRGAMLQKLISEAMTRLGWQNSANALEIQLATGKRWRKRGWYMGDDWHSCIYLLDATGELRAHSREDISNASE